MLFSCIRKHSAWHKCAFFFYHLRGPAQWRTLIRYLPIILTVWICKTLTLCRHFCFGRSLKAAISWVEVIFLLGRLLELSISLVSVLAAILNPGVASSQQWGCSDHLVFGWRQFLLTRGETLGRGKRSKREYSYILKMGWESAASLSLKFPQPSTAAPVTLPWTVTKQIKARTQTPPPS